MEAYSGPACFEGDDRKNWVPISVFSSFSPQVNATRTQYPIKLAYAMTVHKSQGETLNEGVIDFGSSERCLGSSYVQITRFKKFKDFLLVPFAFDRITDKIKNLPMLKERTEEEERF